MSELPKEPVPLSSTERSPPPDCEADGGDHDWEHIADWYGDPGVIGGTCNLYYKRCRICGKEEDDSDYDGGSDYEDNVI